MVGHSRIGARLRRWAFRLVLGGLAALALTWFAHRSVLVGAAALLVDEDPVTPAEIMVVSNSTPQAASLEAALLYRQRVSNRIIIADWIEDPLIESVRALGIPRLGVTDLSKAILERSGVPSSAITILDDRVDGTESEISAIATFVDQHRPASLLIITARSHTARTKWLLHRKLPNGTRVAVHSPRFDRFPVDAWWHDREHSREVITEYLRWFNTMYLPDMWSRQIDSATSLSVS